MAHWVWQVTKVKWTAILWAETVFIILGKDKERNRDWIIAYVNTKINVQRSRYKDI